jgi:hypothetical protein
MTTDQKQQLLDALHAAHQAQERFHSKNIHKMLCKDVHDQWDDLLKEEDKIRQSLLN